MLGKMQPLGSHMELQLLSALEKKVDNLYDEVTYLLSTICSNFEIVGSKSQAGSIKVGGKDLIMISPSPLKKPIINSSSQTRYISYKQFQTARIIEKLYDKLDDIHDSKSRGLNIIMQLAHKKEFAFELGQSKPQIDEEEEDSFLHTNNLEKQQLFTEEDIRAPIHFLEQQVKQIKEDLQGFHIALHDHINLNDKQLVELLLKCGANPGFIYKGINCLERAYNLEDEELLRLVMFHSNKDLVNSNLPDGRAILRWAFDKGDVELFERLMNYRAELLPNAKGSDVICYGPTVLHSAAAQSNVMVVSIILKHYSQSINIAQHDNSYTQWAMRQLCCTITGETPLHCAVKAYINAQQTSTLQTSALDVIRLLSEKGAKVNIRDQDGMTVRNIVASVVDKNIRAELNKALLLPVETEGKKAR